MKKGTLGIILAVVMLFSVSSYFALAIFKTHAEEEKSVPKITHDSNTKQVIKKETKKKSTAKKVKVKLEAVKKDDCITMNITVKNNTKKDVYIENSSGQVFDIQLLDVNKNILYTWSADKSFIQVISTTKLEAGKALHFKEVLSGDMYQEIKDEITYMKVYLTGSADFIDALGYVVKVK